MEEQLGRFVRYFGYVVFTAGLLLILAGYALVFMQQGIGSVLDFLNPFNVWNFIATIAAIVPGLLLIALGKRLERSRS